MRVPFTQSVIDSGRITIPRKVRDMLDIKKDDYVYCEIEKYTESKKDYIYDK